MTRDGLDELGAVVASLSSVLERERNAVSALDVTAMKAAEEEKQRLAQRINELLQRPLPPDPQRRAELLSLVRRARNDLQANAMLIASAAEAVGTLLGLEESATYDLRGRRSTSRPMRRITAF